MISIRRCIHMISRKITHTLKSPVFLSWLTGLLLVAGFSSQAQYVTRRDAQQVSQHCFSVTRDTGNQFGAVWFTSKLDLSRPLSLEFNIYMGSRDSDGADGIAFVMHDDPRGLEAIGERGGGLGYGDHPSQEGTEFIRRSVAIEFDTWQNTDCAGTQNDDPGFDHTTMVYNGNTCAPRFPAVRLKPAGAQNRDNVEDNTCYTFRITWDPATKITRLFNGNSQIFQYQHDFVASVFGGTQQVFYGFTGSTGGSMNEQTVCIVGTNTAPTAQDDVASTGMNTTVRIDAVANDSDADGDDLSTIEIVQAPAHGTAIISSDNKIVYTPATGYVGQDVLRYKACDVNSAACYANCDSATVTITVRPANTLQPLVLTAECSPFPEQQRRWKVTNPNSQAVNFTYEVISTGQSGSLTASAAVDTYFTTQTVVTDPQNTVRISWSDLDGSTKTQTIASSSAACSCGLTLSITGINATCNSDNGSAALTVSGGSGNYSYQWSNGALTRDINNLAPGVYSVAVMDLLNGCGGTSSVTISAPSNCGGDTYSVQVIKTDVTCNGENNGTATVKVTGNFQTKCETAPAPAFTCSSCTREVLTNVDVSVRSGERVCLRVTGYNKTITMEGGTLLICGSVTSPPVNFNSGGQIYVFGSAQFSSLNFNNGALYNYGSVVLGSGHSASGTLANHGSLTINGHLNVNANAHFYNTGTVAVYGDFHNNATTVNSGTLSVSGELKNNGNSSFRNNCQLSIGTEFHNNGTFDQYGKITVGTSIKLNGGGVLTTYPNSEIKTPEISGGGSIVGQGGFCSSILVSGNIGNINTSGSVKVCNTNDTNCICDVTKPPCTYLWSNGATTPTVEDLPPGTYTVKITCGATSVTKTVVIAQPPVLTLQVATQNNVKCHGEQNGSVILSVNGGTGPYSYAWSNGATAKDIQNLAPGDYIVKVTDSNGCTRMDTVTITEPEVLVATPTVEGAGASIQVTGGTGPYTYQWPDGATTPNRSDLKNGVYPVVVTDANGCSVTIDVVVTEGIDRCSDFTATVSVSPVSCSGLSDATATVLVANGFVPYSYTWSTGATTAAINNLGAGDYSVIVQDIKGCIDTVLFAVNDAPAIALTATPTDISCFGKNDGAITLQAEGGTGPLSFLWSNGEETKDITALSAGTYTVTVTDSLGCVKTTTAGVAEPALLSAEIASVQGVSCAGGTDGKALVDVSGGKAPYTFSWSNNSTTKDLEGVAAGNYTLTITDASQCTVAVQVNVPSPDPIALSAVATQASCGGLNDGRVALTVSGGTSPFAFLWSNGATTQHLDNVPAGMYTVVVTDGKGCTSQSTATVSQPEVLVITSVAQPVSCFSAANGAIDLTVTNGTAPYSFRWSHGPVTEDVSALAAGVYQVTVTDAKGCSGTYTATVEEPMPLKITASVTGNSVTTQVTGGTASYTYLWSTGATTPGITGVANGLYTVVVTDARGCKATTVAVVGEATCAGLTATLLPTDVSCYVSNNGSINLTLSGGSGNFSYQWSNGASSEDINNLPEGTYSVIITDGTANCSVTATATIGQPAPLKGVIAIQDAVCGGATGSLDLTVSGGTAPYSFQWSTGAVTEDINTLPAGSYVVRVTDAHACQVTLNANIVQSDPVIATAQVQNNDIIVDVQGGVLPYTFVWSNGSTIKNQYDLPDGTYTLTATDARGCKATTTVVIRYTSLCAGLTASAVHTAASCFGASDAVINLTVQGGSGAFTYRWSTGATTEDLGAVAAGTYTVTVTDVQQPHCQATASVTITEPAALALSTAKQNVTCYGKTDGSIQAIVTGGTAPYTYQWSNGVSGTTVNGLAAGFYSVTVTDAKQCSATASIQITQPSLLNVAAIAVDNDAFVTASGGMAPYTYLWNTGAVTQNLTDVPAGTYTVTVTDASGCTASRSVVIRSSSCDRFAVTLSPAPVSCFGANDGRVDVAVTGGSGRYQFMWTNGASTEDISNLVAGSYKVIVTDLEYGCKTEASATVQAPARLVLTTADLRPASCFGGNDGYVRINITGGTAPYRYVWSNNTAAQNAEGLVAGSYSVTVTDAANCQTSSTFVVGQPTSPLGATVSFVNAACVTTCNGSATVSVTGGTSPYTVRWNTGVNGQTLANVCAGNYTATITDANQCTITKTVTIGGSDPCNMNQSLSGVAVCTATPSQTRGWRITNPNDIDVVVTWDTNGNGPSGTITARAESDTYFETPASAGHVLRIYVDGRLQTTVNGNNLPCNSCALATTVQTTPVSCFGAQDGSATVSVQGGQGTLRYNWSNGATTASVSGLSPGTYTVVIEDTRGCVEQESVVITEPSRLSAVTGTVTPVACAANGNTGAITLNVSGGTAPYAYTWSNGATSKDISGLAAGTYSVTVRDARNCTIQASATITAAPSFTASVAQTTDVSCAGGANGSVNIAISGGKAPFTYSWNTGATTKDLVNVGAGTYTLTVRDANQCTTTVQATVAAPSAINAVLSVLNNTCAESNTGSITTSVTGGTAPYTYEWNTGATTSGLTNLAPGTYVLTVRDARQCVVVKEAVISRPAPLAVSYRSGSVTCAGTNNGFIDITVQGGTSPYQYAWNHGPSSEDLSNLSAGTYTATVTDANGCSKQVAVVITAPGAFTVNVVSTADISCAGGNNGFVDIQVTGGTAPFTYSWSNGATTADLFHAGAGNYTVTVTDANQCTATASATIRDAVAISASLNVTPLTCAGRSDASVAVTATGGTAPYTYAWSNGATTTSISGVPAGTYSVTVRDANNCTFQASAIVEAPAPLAVAAASTPVSCSGAANGSVQTVVSGGQAPYSYSWNNNATTAEITNVAANTYTVIVTDAKGCTATASATVTQPSALSLAVSQDVDVSCNQGSNGIVNVQVSGGTSPYTYAWSNGATTQNQSNLPAGSYTVTVTDARGCTATSQPVVISEPGALSGDVSSSNITCHGANNGTAEVVVSSGTTPYTYRWSNGATTSRVTDLGPGNYSVTVRDANNCVITQPVTIIEPAVLSAIFNVNSISCAGANNGSITTTVSGGTGPYTYQWDNGAATKDLSGLSAGSYVLVIRDAANCTFTSQPQVIEAPASFTVSLTATDASCGNPASGTVTAAVAGGTAPYSYLWSNGATTQNLSNVPPAQYTLTVTDSRQCTATANAVVKLTGSTFSISLKQSRTLSCDDAADAGITSSINGGTAPFQYRWSNGATSANLNNIAAGQYTLTVIDASGCSSTANLSIQKPGVSCGDGCIFLSFVSTPVSCQGARDGSIVVNVIGGSGDYTYRWNTGATTKNLSGLAARSYSVTVTDKSKPSCVRTASITVGDATPLEIEVAGDRGLICGEGDELLLRAEGSAGQYLWSNGATTSTITVSTPGSYWVRVTQGPCTATSTPVQIDRAPDELKIIASGTSMCPGGKITLTSPFSSGIVWSPGGQTSRSIDIFSPGTYSLSVDFIGCYTLDASVTIQQKTQEQCETTVDPLCDPTPFPVVQITEPCDKFATDLVVHNAQRQYQTYLESVRRNFQEEYVRKCMEVTENFSMQYTDKEHHRTLYYYDQGGNLVRTVPPEGVRLINDPAKLAQMKENRANGERTLFTEHTLATTYNYNSLNQLVTQDMPDHQQMDIRSLTAASTGLPAGLTVTATQLNGQTGFLTAHNGTEGSIYFTMDGGKTWSKLYNVGIMNLNDVHYAAGASTVYAVGDEGSLIKSTNNGVSWILKPMPTLANITKMHFFSENEGIVFESNGTIWRTVDGGESLNWTQNNALRTILQGTLSDIAFSGTTGIAFSANGAVSHAYKTTDGGSTWAPVSDFRTIDLYSAHHVTTQQGFAGGIDGTLLKTNDGGQSWQLMPANQAITFRDLFFTSEMTGVALDDSGTKLFRTANGGLQWSNTSLPSGTYYSLSGASATALYIGGVSGVTPLIHRSVDGGSNWFPVITTGLPSEAVAALYFRSDNDAVALMNSGDVYTLTTDNTVDPPVTSWALSYDGALRKMVFVNAMQGFALDASSGLLKTTDGGKTWSVVVSPIASGITFKDIAFADLSNGMAVALNGEIYRTTNGGSSWISSSVISPLAVRGVTLVGTTAYAAGVNGRVWKSVNAGTSWRLQSTANRNDLNTIATVDGSQVAAGGAAGLILRSTNGGTSWSAITSSGARDIYGSSAFNSKNYLVGADNLIVQDNGGMQRYPYNNTPDFKAIASSNNGAVVVGESGAIVRTVDALNWFDANQTITQVLYDAHLVNGSVGYAVGKGGTVIKTVDGGTRWNAMPTGSAQDLNSVHFTNSNTGIIVGNGGTILRTSSGGNDRFPRINAGTSANLRAVHFSAKGDLGVIVGQGGVILTSTNGGQSWTTRPSGTTLDLHGVYVVDRTTVYAVGNNGTILRGTNNGVNWQILTDQQGRNWLTANQLPLGAFRDVYFRDYVTGYVVGDNGVVLKTVTRGQTWEVEDTQGQTGTILNISEKEPGTVVLAGTGSKVSLLNDESDQYGSRFFYDKMGRQIISQNSKQFAKSTPAYSYTLYDPLGRVTEVGEIATTVNPNTLKDSKGYINQQEFEDWMVNGVRTEITRTWYDIAVFEIPDVQQDNLRGRIASSTYQDVDGATYNHATHFTYDVHGNVKTLIQDFPALESVAGNQRYKRVDYEYDLVSNKVNLVRYQEGKLDQYFHKYEYDSDNRITVVYTSKDGLTWDRDAAYQYYKHGPLSRMELGENNLQGVDYAYTIHGWTKGVNSNLLDSNVDIGKDGTGNTFSKDQFGYSLGYHDGDYVAIGATTDMNRSYNQKGLYNGNISSMVSSIGKFVNSSGRTQSMHYEYDQLNRIKETNAYDLGPNGLTAKLDYSESFTYDANGNILTLKRNGTGTAANAENTGMDDLKYIYESQSNGYDRNTNKLKAVVDNTVMKEGLDDIKPGQHWDANDPTKDNYSYDEIGNLIGDKQEGIVSIEWTVYGKVSKILKADGGSAEFKYDALGNRISKRNTTSGGVIETTYYVRDAGGNVMATYSDNSAGDFNLVELMIYGSDRLGLRNEVLSLSEPNNDPNYSYYQLGFKQFELVNHLGNILVTVTDRKDFNGDAIVSSANDYYAFGLIMPGRSFNLKSYRYGYNGKEKDDNGEWGGIAYDYGFRIYNPMIGKFLSVDPLTKEYPWYTPYQFAGNKPIWKIDVDGLEEGNSNANNEPSNVKEEGFWEGFGKQILKSGVDAIKYVMNNPNHAGYDINPRPITQEQIDQYAFNWKSLDPQYQIEAFAQTTVEGIYNFSMGLYNQDGRQFAKSIPSVLSTAGTIYGLRVPTSSLRVLPKLKMPKVGVTINSSLEGLDIRVAKFEKAINPGAKISDLVETALYETWTTGVEHAVIQLKDGTRHLVSGGKHGITLPKDTDILFGHTHPPLRRGSLNTPSPGDRDALIELNQSKQYIYHDGQRTTIYKGKDVTYDTDTTDY